MSSPGPDAAWWHDGEWQSLPDDVLSPDSGLVTLAVNADESPDLAALIRAADDVDGYLRSLGVSVDDLDDPEGYTGRHEATADAPDDEMGMGMGAS